MPLCIIPARGGSKRIPRKNICELGGQPMIAWSIKAAIESALFDDVVVSTDDREIADVAVKYGARVPFLREPDLADDHTGTVPVIADALRRLEAPPAADDPVCCLYPTAPFVESKDLRAALELLQSSGGHYAVPVTTFAFPIQRAVRRGSDERVTLFDPSHATTRSQDLEEAYHDAGQFYWALAKTWLSEATIFGESTFALPIARAGVVDIDTPEDLEVARGILQARAAEGSP